jgi:subtilase family serine protease
MLCMGAFVLCAAGALSTAAAQTALLKVPSARSLITAPIDPQQRVALPGHVVTWARAEADQGAVSAELPLTHLTLALSRSTEREAAFQQRLKDLQDPTSPQYHHWLTPVEFGEQFGAAQEDIDAISAWLTGQGLHVDAVSNSRMRITFSGSAGAVANTFGTTLRYYAIGSETRIANADAPHIPVALGNAVQGVVGLHTMKFRPAMRQRAHEMTAPALSTQPASSNCSGGTCSHYVFPADFAKIYNLPSAFNGSGQDIAIVGKSRVYDQDDINFKARTGVSFAEPTVIIPPSGTDPGAPATTCPKTNADGSCDTTGNDAIGNQGEATLDVQRAGSVAPGANLKLIVSSDVGQQDGVIIAIEYAIDHSPVPAKILSISFASCESDNGSSASIAFDQLYQQAAIVEGISVFVASGDSGAACGSLDAAPKASDPISTNTLCASGYVTCVGGTEFGDAANPTQYWSNSNGAGYLSALGYIPEGAWNDPLDSKGNPQYSATGGGYSLYIATPSWQKGTGVPGTQGRYTPDLSFAASTREGYFTCTAAEGGSCVVNGGSFSFIGSGGTSASTPSMAGIAALLNQKLGSSPGNLNPRLYALAATPANGVFHDVTVASSGVTGCSASVPSLCNNSTPGPTGLSGGLTGYLVGTGYDEATGLGSVDVTNLLNQWNASGSGGFNLDQHGLTGPWYNSSTSGQGLLIETYPDFNGVSGKVLFFAGWYTYDVTAAGGQRWYSLGAAPVDGSATSVPMNIYANTGGNFNAPPSTNAVQVGTATLSFTDCTHGSLQYTFTDGSGRSGTIPLTRVDVNVTCTSSGDSGSAGHYLLSGAWGDSTHTTSGQGLLLDVNPQLNLFFAAWYTYAPNGAAIGGGASQRWYSIQDTAFAPGAVSKSGIPIYEPTGGVFNSGTNGAGSSVGTATITFQSCTAATLSYNFTSGSNAGKSGSVSLGRVVGAPAGCSL